MNNFFLFYFFSMSLIVSNSNDKINEGRKIIETIFLCDEGGSFGVYLKRITFSINSQ